jgi:hypothetical protein
MSQNQGAYSYSFTGQSGVVGQWRHVDGHQVDVGAIGGSVFG